MGHSRPKLAAVVALITVTALLSAAPSEAARPAPREPTSEVAAGVNALGLDLYARAQHAPGNLVFSPASVGTALGMVYGGAAGRTARELARVLHLAKVPAAEVHAGFAGLLARAGGLTGATLRVANRLWGRADVAWAPEFLGLTRDRYGAEAERADFAAAEPTRRAINAWVAKITEGRIAELLPAGSVDASTVLVLVNAIWFKGKWATPFPAAATHDAPFARLDGGTKAVPTMHRMGPARLARVGDVELAELDYAGGALSMVIAVDHAGTPAQGLAALERRLGADLDTWLGALADVPELNVELPRFEARQELPLAEHLAALGAARLFDARADLSPMLASHRKGLAVSGVYHQAFVKVDEEGPEAAAATGVSVATCAAPNPVPFRADRPFVWMIRDKRTGLLLFLGRVVDPA